MAYVLEVISKDGKIKYINSAKATVYCPEYAARYDDKKTCYDSSGGTPEK